MNSSPAPSDRSPASPSRAEIWRGIVTYLVLATVLSGLFDLLIIRSGRLGVANNMYVTALMWSPGVAALVTCRLRGISLAALGWQWPAWRHVRYAWLLPVGYGVVTYGVIWAAGGGGFPDAKRVTDLETTFDLVGYATPMVLAVFVLISLTVGVLRSTTFALGEEIGWRGFLVPQLMRVMGFRATVLVSGTVWVLYHVPVLVLADYNSGTPWWFGLSCFAVMVYGMSAIMASVRMRSGSLWPAAILHASHNLFVQSVLTPLTTDTGRTRWLIDEFGIGLAISIGAIGAWTMWRERARG